MPGTRQSSLLAVATNKAKHGEDYYKRIGSLGGKTPTTKPKGFASMDKARLSEIGKRGGKNAWVSRKRDKSNVSVYSADINH